MPTTFTKAAIIALSLLALTSLSACAPANSAGSQTAWENVHGGFLIENIYTGEEDHI